MLLCPCLCADTLTGFPIPRMSFNAVNVSIPLVVSTQPKTTEAYRLEYLKSLYTLLANFPK